MAKVVNGLLVGRVGNLVYYILNGKQCVRSYKKPRDPKTSRQVAHRLKIKVCTKFLKSFWNVIKIGYASNDIAIKNFNEAFNYHLVNAMEEFALPENNETSYRVIPENVKLASGLINEPVIYSCERNGLQIELAWKSELGPIPNRHTDQVVVTAYIPEQKAYTVFHAGIRKEGGGKIVMPGNFNQPVHVWVFYWNPEKKAKSVKERVSDSVYLGLI